MHSFCGTSLRTEYNMLISVLRLILSAGFIDKCRQICFALHIQRQTKIADIRKAHLNAFQAFKVGFNSSLIKSNTAAAALPESMETAGSM